MAKCEFCNAENATLRDNGKELCDSCYSYLTTKEAMEKALEKENESKMEKEENKIIEANFTDVKEAKEPAEEETKVEETPDDIKTELVIGIKRNNSTYLKVNGFDTNLVAFKGLIEYANRQIEHLWDSLDYQEMQEELKKRKEAEENKEKE